MAAVASGAVKNSSLSPEQAAEFMHADRGRVKRLPERSDARSAQRKRQLRGKASRDARKR